MKEKHQIFFMSGKLIRCSCGWVCFVQKPIENGSNPAKDFLLDAFSDHSKSMGRVGL